MGVQVTFNFQTWIARFPEFEGTVDGALASQYFIEAQQYHANDGTGPITDPTLQLVLLNLVVAHIAARYAINSGTGQSAAPAVGRISYAQEGSVVATTHYGSSIGEQMAFWLQTRYGADYWAMTRPFRMFHYRPHKRHNLVSRRW